MNTVLYSGPIGLLLWIATTLAAAPAARNADHWSFQTIRKPDVPQVQNTDWVRNEIDHFVLAKLENAGKSPSPQADPATLFRRVSIDLLGLPPELDALDDYLADGTEGAYLRAIDSFLQSAHYGERMAQDWLDLARYGDTNGYHSDSDRSMWLYRDYVIGAFNRNKPFNRFIIENMAGDLLPDASEETKVASGFNRCVTFNEEGGADPDEFYVTYAVDRANTAGQVFLGLTLGCAQCHDHKYDPISMKEYYQLYAFFNSVEGEIGAGGESGYHGKPLPPLLSVRTERQKETLAALEREIESLEAGLKLEEEGIANPDPNGPMAVALARWESNLKTKPASGMEVREGLQLWLDAADLDGDGKADDDLSVEKPVARWSDRSDQRRVATSTGKPRRVPGAIGGLPAVRLDGVHDFLRTEGGAQSLTGDFTLLAVFQLTGLDKHQMLLMWGDESQGKRRAMWKTEGQNRFSFNGYSADVVGTATIAVNAPCVGVITKRGDQIRFSINGKAAGEGKVKLNGFEGKAITIGANNAGSEKTAGEFGEVLIFDRVLSDSELASVGRHLGSRFGIETDYQPAPPEILDIVELSEVERTAEQRARLLGYFARHVHGPSRARFERLESELAAVRQRRDEILKSTPSTMVMVEMAKRKPAYILARGDFQQPGEEVQPDVPGIFPGLPEGQPRNRLGLAHWLTDARHPLVARVTVNRFWKQLFGNGLVRTLGDFGTRGERPSHPELLDWLAADFIESGWDVKRLQRLMLSSATYRQSARRVGVDQEDPENRLLSRAQRFRLSAEEIRDVSLAISGLLNPMTGGPSVMPYQPESYLRSIGKGWSQSKGSGLYRRGLYTFWRRTMLYPTFQIFDSPSREFCSVKRPRTNTPLQALVTMNDPTFVEAARVFGQRILAMAGAGDRERLIRAWRVATARSPSEGELTLLTETLNEQRAIFRADPAAAEQLGSVGESGMPEGVDRTELAAWTALANVVLNLDEVITRE